MQPRNTALENQFGTSIVMDEDRIIVGARGTNAAGPRSGAAYVFKRQGATWRQVHRLTAVDARQDMEFGAQLSLSGKRLAVGCPANNTLAFQAGAVYMFEESQAGEWSQRPEPLYAYDSSEGSNFGGSISLSGNLLLVGADSTEDRGQKSGSAYVFHFDGSDWQHHQKLKPTSNTPTYKQHFGRTVAIHNNRLYISIQDRSTCSIEPGIGTRVLVKNDRSRPCDLSENGRDERLELLPCARYRK